MRSERFERSPVRQTLFDDSAGGRPVSAADDDGGEVTVLPSADLGFAKAYWSIAEEQLSHLDRFLAARDSVEDAVTEPGSWTWEPTLELTPFMR